MPEISRNGDKDSRNDTKISSSTVYINNQSVLKDDDLDTRGDIMVGSSNDVFVENKGVCRKGDLDSRGDVLVGASSDVFAN